MTTDEDDTPPPAGGGLQVHPGSGDAGGDGVRPGFSSVPAPAGAGADDDDFDDEAEGGDFASAAAAGSIPGPPPPPVTQQLTDEEKAAKAREKRQAKLFEAGELRGAEDLTPQTWIPDDAVVETKVVMKGGAVGLRGGAMDWDKTVRCFVVAEVQGRSNLVVRDRKTREPTGEFEETYTLRPTRTENIESAMRDPATGLLDLARQILVERGELGAQAA